ncbi:rubredoxin [Salipiger aestuarii]|uniref:Rubredoxin n=1 Tax=Salipiger aestuarii TaxID=568098 RepID=A0A327XRT7_9RHOB|nr:rubredoxin [Salipiger aestuarii]RAK10646.1 rubredoxin [Salipiger aestuarii]
MATYECPDCGYTYDEIQGHPHEGFPPGTPWSQVPDDFACPDCAVRDKQDFILIGGSPSGETAPAQVVEPAPAPIPEPAPAPAPVAVAVAVAPAAPPTPQAAPAAQATPVAGTAYRKWLCITCGHIYDEALGDEHEGFPPGTLFSQIPDDWCCPDCGATKEDYVLYEEN